MRVLHILDHSIPLHSGYSFRTAAILREQRALGWATFQLTSPKHTAPGPDEEDVDGLHFYRTRWQANGMASLPGVSEVALMKAIDRRLDEVVTKVRPDILHAHSPVLNAFPAIRVGRRRGIPVVYEVRAFWEDAAVDHGTTREGSPRYRMTRLMETWALKRVDHVFTICEGLRRDIVERGIALDKVTVILNAVDVEAFRLSGAPDAELRRTLQLGDGPVLGFVGSFYAYEGLDLLVDAVARLAPSRPSLRVLLVGGGPQDAALREQVQHLGLQEVVRFCGRVPHSEVARYYDQIDLLVYPRHSMRLTELVTPLKPLEAMAQGRVFIASDVGGHKELIRDGETGRLFPAGDVGKLAQTIVDMLADRGRWQSLRAAGRRLVETERTWRSSVAHYRAAYSRLVSAEVLAGNP